MRRRDGSQVKGGLTRREESLSDAAEHILEEARRMPVSDRQQGAAEGAVGELTAAAECIREAAGRESSTRGGKRQHGQRSLHCG